MSTKQLVSAIQITDRHTRQLVAAESARRGDLSAAKTARDLVVERLAQLETRRAGEVEPPHQLPTEERRTDRKGSLDSKNDANL